MFDQEQRNPTHLAFCQSCHLTRDEPFPHLVPISFQFWNQHRCYTQQWTSCPSCHPSHSKTHVIPAPLHHSVTTGDEYLQQTQCALCFPNVWFSSLKKWTQMLVNYMEWRSFRAGVKHECIALTQTPSSCRSIWARRFISWVKTSSAAEPTPKFIISFKENNMFLLSSRY